MAFLIQNHNGRLRICTYSAEAAAAHVQRLREAGQSVKVTDVNGDTYRLGALFRRAAEDRLGAM